MKLKNVLLWGPLLLLLLFAFVFRLYKINEPIADWHSWRQTDTAAVSKLFVQNGIDVLHPKYFDISNVQSGFDNPQGYRFVEFPLFNVIHVALYSVFGIWSIDVWARLTTILFSLAATTFIFLLVRKYLSVRAAYAAAFFYAFLPFSIFYGRTVLPDTAMIASVLGGIYFFSVWVDRKSQDISSYIYLFISLVFTIASLLFKPYALFFLLPIAVLSIEKFGFSAFKKIPLWIFAILSVIPLAVWRMWITQFPEGIPVSSWLFNAGNIRFKGAYFYWIFGERISQLILGYYVTFAIIGLFKKATEKHFWFYISFFISSLAYLIVIARGNVQHDYYQIAIVPSLAILIGRGIDFILSIPGKLNKVIAVAIIVVSTFLMFSLSWYHVRDYFNINNRSMVEAGIAADKLLPKNAKVIAPREGDTTFLYYINRQGWPHFQASTEELIQKGATHMIILEPSDQSIAEYAQQYSIIASESAYIIMELK